MPLDENDLKKVGELIAGALKSNNEAQAAEVGKLVDSKIKPLSDEIETRKTADKTEKEKADKEKSEREKAERNKNNTGNNGGNTPNPEVEELRKRLDEQEQERAKERAAVAKEREDNARKELRASAKAALEDAGVPKSLSDGAVLVLEANGTIVANKEGKAAFKGKGKYNDEVVTDGKAGAVAWLATDAGKAYVPPKPGAGTGDGAGTRQGGSGTGANAPRNKDGSLNWGALRGKAGAGILEQADGIDVPDMQGAD